MAADYYKKTFMALEITDFSKTQEICNIIEGISKNGEFKFKKSATVETASIIVMFIGLISYMFLLLKLSG